MKTAIVVFATNPIVISPNLGTPSALVGTNITGTAAGLNIGGNAATARTVGAWQVPREIERLHVVSATLS